ncbi:MFS transporter [Limibaculum sp. M0105]|uniref:MFS transporter n=1 Tax=Thermohalobaculum xanthum TaxID=2753746 RepID=A0A8J7M4D9_9RHOB|nr:MFS transporter [Thermohalobaculum xanthum]MBK0398044.1 MFS transporter [Thermohalobaculum xanthum]
MALNVRHPIWLSATPSPGVRTFATLFLLETMARASTATIVPLQAYELLADERQVSFLYTAVGLVALAASFAIPVMIRRLSRRWTYTIGALALCVAYLALWSQTVSGQATGMLLRVFGTSCLNIALSLYVMDFIRKQDFVRNDATRMAISTIGWSSAPTIGVWLYTGIGPAGVYVWSIAWSTILIAVFWYFRLTENKVIVPGRIAPSNPLRNVRRFLAQPRLRLAWTIAFGRSCFWVTFFVYVPITMVAAGEGKAAGAYVISAGNALLISALLWQRINGRIGVRGAIVSCFAILAVSVFCAGVAGVTAPWWTAGFLLVGAFAASGLDAIGAVPFYRAVHVHERPEMTAVYRTYMDVSELAPLFVYGVLLTWFGLGVVFIALSGLMLVCGLISLRHLPRRL